jgi:hypothetical protein
VTKLPTAVSDLDAWTDPDNVKADDGVCASKTTSTNGTYTLACSGYGFAIPAGSTITKIRIFIDANYSRIPVVEDRYITFTLTKTGGVYGVQSTNAQTTPACSKSTKDYYQLLAGALTVAQLNAESFTTKIEAVILDGVSSTFYCDCVGIEVTYTEPSAEKDAFDALAFAT